MYPLLFSANRTDSHLAHPGSRVAASGGVWPLALLVMTWGGFVCLVGCGPAVDHSMQSSAGRTSIIQSGEEHLASVVEYLDEFGQVEPIIGRERIEYHLTEWLVEESGDPSWLYDPLYRRIPSEYSRLPKIEMIDGNRILGGFDADADHLRLAYTAQQIGSWVRDLPLDDPDLDQWFATLSETDFERAEQLALGYRLFDWTIRNVQLDPLPPWKSLNEVIRGFVAPGGRFSPLEVLQMGHGDAYERARVFIQLARQQGLTVVMVAQEVEGQDPHPWAAGLQVGDELYLFEMELGLPFLSTAGEGIASLSDLAAQPELLRQFDLPEQPYPVEAQALESMMFLIDATPEDVSLRMRLLQQQLSEELALVLCVAPAKLASQLPRVHPGDRAVIWSAPLSLVFYRAAISGDIERQLVFAKEHFPFERMTPLAQAREAHLRGQFRGDQDQQGTGQLYMLARPSTREIEQITDREAIESYLELNHMLPTQVVDRQQAILQEEQRRMHEAALVVQMKQAATYWMGISLYEQGEYGVAMNYFQRHVINAASRGYWVPGAEYHLGRCYEAQAVVSGRSELLEQAIALYEASQSPQRHGDLVRAARLRSRHSQTSLPPAE